LIKYLHIISLFLILSETYGQTDLLSKYEVKEYCFTYSDSINGQITYGNYEPTGIVSLANGSFIVSTVFSINFPEQNQLPDTFSQEYFDKQRIYRGKSHISSGSVFMLNENFEKQWEVIFKDKRVKGIKKLSNENVLIAGESVDLEFFWIAEINMEGDIIYEKNYKFKRSPSIDDFEIDSLNNLYLLLSTERINPIKVTKRYGKRRIILFQESDMESDIYLIKIDSGGKINWKKPIETRKNFWAYGSNLIIGNKIYFSLYSEGFIKKKKEWIKKEGEFIYEYMLNGEKINSYASSNKYAHLFNTGLIYSSFANNDTLELYFKDSIFESIETISFKNNPNQFWIEKALFTAHDNYLTGTSNHNLGCIIFEFDHWNNYKGYWKYDTASFVDAVIEGDNAIVIIARSYSNLYGNQNMGENYSIKIIRLKNNGG